MKSLKRFPVIARTIGATTTYTALCGYVSTDGKQFVDPRNYKPERIAACCQNYKKVNTNQDSYVSV